MFGSIGIPELLIVLVFGVAGTIFWIWTLIKIVTKERDTGTRVTWVLIVVFTHWLGALVYWIVRGRRI